MLKTNCKIIDNYELINISFKYVCQITKWQRLRKVNQLCDLLRSFFLVEKLVGVKWQKSGERNKHIRIKKGTFSYQGTEVTTHDFLFVVSRGNFFFLHLKFAHFLDLRSWTSLHLLIPSLYSELLEDWKYIRTKFNFALWKHDSFCHEDIKCDTNYVGSSWCRAITHIKWFRSWAGCHNMQ